MFLPVTALRIILRLNFINDVLYCFWIIVHFFYTPDAGIVFAFRSYCFFIVFRFRVSQGSSDGQFIAGISG